MFETASFVLGLTQVIKMTAYIPHKFMPLVATILGAVIHPIIIGKYSALTILQGAFIGMTTTGVVNLVSSKIKK